MDIYKDRRRFPRVDTKANIQYKNLRTSPEMPSQTVINDISEGGTRFLVSEFLSLATRLILEINLPNTPKTIKAIAKVAWVKKTAREDTYEVGNQFLDMTKEDKRLISSFVSSQISSD